MPSSWKSADFPNLNNQNHQVTSQCDSRYNCIAWAAGDNGNWWWPHPDGFWPDGIAREETIDAFKLAYNTIGYVECLDGSIETGFDKVAIYAVAASGAVSPTHAARQLLDGRWASKLGPLEDIEHAAAADVCGPIYGDIVCYLKRPKN